MPDFRNLTLKQLRALTAVVEHRTVTAASKALSLTPPAVTTQLKLLENGVGAPVFDRTPDGFVLTEIGREMFTTAEMIDKRIAIGADRINALKSGAAGSVAVGVVSTGKYFAPALVAEFQKSRPNIRVKLIVGNREKIITALEHDEFDVAIMGRPPPTVPVERSVLCDHPHILIAAPDHRLSNDPDILADDLLRERFLAREPGSGTRVLMERYLDRISHGRSFEVVEMGTNETIKQAVMAGLGIAIISAHTCYSELQDGKLIRLDLPGLPLVRQWILIRRSDRQSTKAAEAFSAFVMQRSRDIIPKM